MSTPRTTAPLIRLDGIRKTYATRNGSHLAVSDATFDIDAGAFVALVGPSGCGKSTMLRILAGLIEPDAGTLSFARGIAAGGRDVGIVFQQPLLLKWRTIRDNVLLPAEILGLPRRQSRERAAHLLDLVGLTGAAAKYPHELSGGMQQRAAIARALVHDPALLLMDEPFGALDAITRERINLEMLRIWQDSGKTIVFVTHSIPEAIFLASTCVVLTAGPARMADRFAVDLPYPRVLAVKTTEPFGNLAARVYRTLGLT